MAVAGPRTNGTDGLYRSSEGCGRVRNGWNWGDCKMSWPEAALGRDLSSTLADDGGVHYTGGGWGGCSGVVYWEGTYGEGRYHICVDSGSLSYNDVAGELQMALHGNNTYKMGRCCSSPKAWRGFWVQLEQVAAEASSCGSC